MLLFLNIDIPCLTLRREGDASGRMNRRAVLEMIRCFGASPGAHTFLPCKQRVTFLCSFP